VITNVLFEVRTLGVGEYGTLDVREVRCGCCVLTLVVGCLLEICVVYFILLFIGFRVFLIYYLTLFGSD
jgi:hypothetical protein